MILDGNKNHLEIQIISYLNVSGEESANLN